MNTTFVVIAMPLGLRPAKVVIIDKVLRVVDGDTFVCHVARLPQGAPDEELVLRLDGEPRPPGLNAYVESQLRQASFIFLRNFRRDSGFRLLPEVFVDWHNLSAIVAELAKTASPEHAFA